MTLEDIIWKSLIYNKEIFERFEVSTDGKIRNVQTHKVYKTYINKNGYLQICVSLGNRNKKKVFRVHKAVAETFIPNLESKPEVNHKDGNKLNNCISNLEWATSSENTVHAYNTGLKCSIRGIDHVGAKLSEDDVRYIREHYIPRHKEYGSRALGRKFSVDHMQILRIINGTKYANT